MAMTKCPVCGVSVKVENLERHVKNQHPKETVDISEALSAEELQTLQEGKAARRPGLTRGGRRMLVIVGIVVAALVALAILYPLLTPRVTDFTLSSTDGPTVSMSAWRGTPVLIEFMDLDCPYCQEEAPVLRSLFANYSGRVNFVSIDIDFEGQADTAARINAERSTAGNPFYGTNWPYCLDPNRIVQSNYQVSSTPTVFIMTKNGTVYQEVVGAHPASDFIPHLNAVVGG